MIQKNCDSSIPQPGPLNNDDEMLLKASYDMVGIARQHASQQSMKQMCEAIINVAKLGTAETTTHTVLLLILIIILTLKEINTSMFKPHGH